MKVNGDASIDKKFQEALIYNGVISEEEVIKLCNTYDRVSLKAHVPDEIVKTVKFLYLPFIPKHAFIPIAWVLEGSMGPICCQ